MSDGGNAPKEILRTKREQKKKRSDKIELRQATSVREGVRMNPGGVAVSEEELGPWGRGQWQWQWQRGGVALECLLDSLEVR